MDSPSINSWFVTSAYVTLSVPVCVCVCGGGVIIVTMYNSFHISALSRVTHNFFGPQ